MDKEEMIQEPEYWLEGIQNELYNMVAKYLKDKGITRDAFAKELGVSKGYISQVLNGNSDHRLSKMIQLCLATGNVPKVEFVPFSEYLCNNKLQVFFYQKNISYHAPDIFDKSDFSCDIRAADYVLKPAKNSIIEYDDVVNIVKSA